METKRCSKCGETKPLSEFHVNHSTKDGRRHQCKICVHEYERKRRADHPEEAHERDRKKREAHKDDVNKRQRRWYVDHKDEEKARQHEYYLSHRDKIKERNCNYHTDHPGVKRKSELKIKYNLSPDGYEAMLSTQNGKCAICGRDHSRNKPLVVDHDHDSGKVRGLICSKCNVGLGEFQDSASMILKAVEYLRVFEMGNE